MSMLETFKTLDLSKYNIFLDKDKRFYYLISNYGIITKFTKNDNKPIFKYNGFFKGTPPNEGNFSVKIKGKVFPIYRLVLEHFTDLEIDKFNLSFMDGNKKNCSIFNMRLDLKHKFINTENSRKLLLNSYESQQLHRILNHQLAAKLFKFKGIYQRDDLIQDFYFFVNDTLYDFENKPYPSFKTFLFLKARDFISRIRKKADYFKHMESLEEHKLKYKTEDRIDFNVRNGCFFTNSN